MDVPFDCGLFDFGFPDLAGELFRLIGSRFGRFAPVLRVFEFTQRFRKSPELRPDKAKKLHRQKKPKSKREIRICNVETRCKSIEKKTTQNL